MHLLRRPGPAWMVLWLSSAPPAASLPRPVASEDPPPTTLPPRPISDSIEKVVERLEKERADPCRKTMAEGKPCFPVSTIIRGPETSVRESLGILGPGTAHSPDRPPTKGEMAPYRPGPVGQVVPLLGFDPGCVGKSALKKLKGKNDVYYLYRIRDVHGVRVALYDRRLDATTFQGDLEFLGKFDGECDALAAYRQEQRKLEPRPDD
jgi:hypothetical protein